MCPTGISEGVEGQKQRKKFDGVFTFCMFEMEEVTTGKNWRIEKVTYGYMLVCDVTEIVVFRRFGLKSGLIPSLILGLIQALKPRLN